MAAACTATTTTPRSSYGWWREPSCTVSELQELLFGRTTGYILLPTEPYNEVYPGIYLGDETTALSTHILRQIGITHVLNAASVETFMPNGWQSIRDETRDRNANDRWTGQVRTSAAYYSRAGILHFLGIPASDTIYYNMAVSFQKAADFIEQALASKAGRVLVHCQAGISRSATLVIAYLMIKRNFTVRQALHTVSSRRKIYPNQGFLQQLCDLEDELIRKNKNHRSPLLKSYATTC